LSDRGRLSTWDPQTTNGFLIITLNIGTTYVVPAADRRRRSI